MSACTTKEGVTVVEKEFPSTPEYEKFKKAIKEMSGIDLNSYKYQIHRRIKNLMEKIKVNSYTEYLNMLKTDKKRWEQFLNYLTINVSEFLRNPERFKILQENIIPELLKERSALRIWSAGCATGEEPYTLAIIAEEMKLSPKTLILATDIDKDALAKAMEGIYEEKQLVNLSADVIEKYFQREKDGRYRVKDTLKKRIKFKRHNLLEDPFEKDFDLILCRNVVIYFSKETKDMLYRRFSNALRLNGYLMTGSTEQIFNARQFGLKMVYPFFYKKVAESS